MKFEDADFEINQIWNLLGTNTQENKLKDEVESKYVCIRKMIREAHQWRAELQRG